MKSNQAVSIEKKIILVTGAARSGKSEWAETLAVNSHKSVVYVATAMMYPSDREWQERIIKHQERRPSSWTIIAETADLTNLINQAQSDCCILVDSLGSWVANLLEMEADNWIKTINELLYCLCQTNLEIIFVAEETGWGVVPAYKSGRLFRDRLGHLSRQIGSMADKVYLITGGHVLDLSVLGIPLSKTDNDVI